MRLYIICFALGVWWLQQQAALPVLAGWVVALALPGFWLARSHNTLLYCAGRCLVALMCLAAGFFWAAERAQVRLADVLPVAWEGRDIRLVGVIASLPRGHERSLRFEFDVERVLTPGASAPRRIVLSWWGRAGGPGVAPILPEIAPGERWQLTVRLKRPHGSANPHGFDYEAWLLDRGIRATGYVRPRGGAERLAAMVYQPGYVVEVARDRLRQRIQAALGDRPYAGIITALAMGEQRAIPANQWQVFTRTGVNHLMSISGLHITMVSGLVFALAGGLWRRSAGLTLFLPARRAAAFFGLLAAVIYTLLAGYAVPAQRTLYMVTVLAVSIWVGVAGSATTVLLVALLVVVVLDPWAVLAPGFWLSFGAVGIILFVSLNRIALPHWLAAWAHVQWAITLALVPMLLGMFQQVSMVSPLANALAIPVVGLGVVPVTLLGMMLPFDALLQFAHLLMAGCMAVLEWLSELPDAVWEQHAPPPWTLIIALMGALWLLLPRGFPGRYLGVLAFLPLFLVLPQRPAEGDVNVTVLDVGQGLAVTVQTRNHALVFDTGPPFGPEADSGNRIVVPYLRAAGVRRLDGLIISHDDMDHTGGALSVLQAMPVQWLLSSLPDLDPLPLHVDHAYRCIAGRSWEWDGIRFELLHPVAGSYALTGIRDNDRSCVLRINTRAGAILIPGDIERRAELELLQRDPRMLAARVLIAPHQGSRTSSTPDFVAAVSPEHVIFPAGYRNRFGHPHQDVVRRYLATGSHVYRTAEDGAVLIRVRAGDLQLERYRQSRRRYWHATPDPESLGREELLDRIIM